MKGQTFWRRVATFLGAQLNDRAGAMLVPPERRFVTGWLGHKMTAEGVPRVPFTIWPEIAEHLLG